MRIQRPQTREVKSINEPCIRSIRLNVPPHRIEVRFDPERERALAQQPRQLQGAVQPLQTLAQRRITRDGGLLLAR
jgi:hypothetical protein